MAWCARIYIWNEDDQSNRPQYSSHVHDRLGMIPKEQKQSFSHSRRQLTSKCTWIKGSDSFHQTSTSWASMKKMLSKVSNTSLMSNKIMEEIRMLSMGSTTIHPCFHIDGIPQLGEHGDSIGQTKTCNGVCSRDRPRVREHYEHRWFWFDLRIAHTQIKDLGKTIDPTTDHKDQLMKISFFFNKHTKRYPLAMN